KVKRWPYSLAIVFNTTFAASIISFPIPSPGSRMICLFMFALHLYFFFENPVLDLLLLFRLPLNHITVNCVQEGVRRCFYYVLGSSSTIHWLTVHQKLYMGLSQCIFSPSYGMQLIVDKF